jgi:cytidylate kinase
LQTIPSIDQPTEEKTVENQINLDEINGRLNFLAEQRNAAQNENVILAGRLAAAMAKVAELSPEFEEVEEDGNDSSEQE